MAHSFDHIHYAEKITCTKCGSTDYPRIEGMVDMGHIYVDKVWCTHCKKLYWKDKDYFIGLIIATVLGLIIIKLFFP